MKTLRISTVLLVAALAAASWLTLRTRDPIVVRAPLEAPAAREDGSIRGALDLAPVEARARTPAASRAVADEVREPRSEAPARGLVELLADVARAERERAVDVLEARVLEALAPPFGLDAILHLLESETLDENVEAQGGAVTTLALAATRDRASGSDAVVLAILDALPALRETARSRITPVLSTLVVEDRPVLGAHLWPRLLELRRAHGEIAEDVSPLFANLHRDHAGLDAQVPTLVAAVELTAMPDVVAAAARCLWALDPDLGAAIVADLRRRPGNDPELARELAQLAARRLEPRAAVDSLAGESTSVALAGMLVLADRPDAGEVLRTKYSELVVAGGDERGRANVVFGMRREDSGVLLGIAETDPSPRVREQALLTLTSTRAIDASSVASLRALRRSGRASISAQACVTAAGNVVVKSRGRAREDALALLREVAEDPSVGAADRAHAVELLGKHAPSPGESNPPPPEADQAGK